MIVAGIGCRTGVSAEAVVALVQEATSFLVALGLDPRVYPSGRPDGDWAPQWVGPRDKPEGDEVRSAGDEGGAAGDGATTTVIRGLDPRTYPFGRPDGAAAPQGVGPRDEPEGDEIRAAGDAATTTVIRGLDPRTYPSGRPDGVAAPQGVGPRDKSEGDEGGAAGDGATTTVIRGLDPRTYPSGRPDGVGAPQGVGPRVKPEGDEGRAAGDEGGAAGDGATTTVIRGLDPRTYPFGRPDGDWAPQWVGPRDKPEGDEGGAAGDDVRAEGDEVSAADHREGVAALAVPAFRNDEPGIAEAATRLNLPILWVERDALKGEQGRCLTRSARAEAETGLSCVAEAAALAAAGTGSRLVLPRIAGGGVTCALAEGPGRP